MDDLSPRPQISHHQEPRPRRHKKRHSWDLLPTEVVLQIISYLSTPAHLSLRLSSRRFHASSSEVPLITQLWFSPYLEDRKTFMGVCDHPFLGEHVTALTYDITRFREFSFEDLRRLWPRPWRYEAEPRNRHQREKGWLENHPGPWKYLEIVKEAKSSAFDEGRALTERLRKLPSVKTVRLAFAFQKGWLVTREERMSPLRMYSDVEWVRRQKKPWDATINGEHMGMLLDAITKSGAHIEELDLWQDYITVPLSAFKFKERFDELSVIFSRLTRLTIRISKSSLENQTDVTAFRMLLALAKKLRQIHLCVNPWASEDHLKKLVDHSTLAQMRMIKSTRHLTLLNTGRSSIDWRDVTMYATASETHFRNVER
ncbi:hypothetical protein VF21_09948 [Pseudogymnoascus sp. 05NY08]|nr:hypothetical protein VF21_09948 [Pseudogymnoascus sp. 05NY08]